MAEDIICASCGPDRPCKHELAARETPQRIEPLAPMTTDRPATERLLSRLSILHPANHEYVELRNLLDAALAEAAQGAAPRNCSCGSGIRCDVHAPDHRRSGHPDGCTCVNCGPWLFDKKPSEGAAPRAEGLDVDDLLDDMAELGRIIQREPGLDAVPEHIEISGHKYVHVAACPCPEMQAEIARLSRPSDERVPESEER